MPQQNPDDLFTLKASDVIQRLLQNPSSVPDSTLQWLRNQYAPNDYMQGILGPMEHQAFAREASNTPLNAAAIAAAIPAYDASKAAGIIGGRSQPSLDSMFSGWQGVLEGLKQYFQQAPAQQAPTQQPFIGVRG